MGAVMGAVTGSRPARDDKEDDDEEDDREARRPPRRGELLRLLLLLLLLLPLLLLPPTRFGVPGCGGGRMCAGIFLSVSNFFYAYAC
jgi:hypothetical protein